MDFFMKTTIWEGLKSGPLLMICCRQSKNSISVLQKFLFQIKGPIVALPSSRHRLRFSIYFMKWSVGMNPIMIRPDEIIDPLS